ncbi:hypothetical protein TRVL_08323 [Trypanosoma vivax]|nr:hypothetical protein TRVL_08323 [Trypanosoma vivax]
MKERWACGRVRVYYHEERVVCSHITFLQVTGGHFYSVSERSSILCATLRPTFLSFTFLFLFQGKRDKVKERNVGRRVAQRIEYLLDSRKSALPHTPKRAKSDRDVGFLDMLLVPPTHPALLLT